MAPIPIAISEALGKKAGKAGSASNNMAMGTPKTALTAPIRLRSTGPQAQTGDLAITADIPWAAEVIEKGCLALNPRGELYTTENIKQRLNVRDFMEPMRASGINTGGPPPLSHSDRMAFANQLDRLLAKLS